MDLHTNIDKLRKEYFDNKNNPYSLSYYYVYCKETHTAEEIVQRGILSIYNYLKYVIRHFDNGYGNFGTSVPVCYDLKMSDLPKRYIKYIDYLKSENLLHYEFLIFTLALLIRDKDPKDDDGEYEDYYYPNNHSYPIYKLLVSAHEKKSDITFEEAMDIILSNNEYYYNMTKKEYFKITYNMLILSVQSTS